MIYIGLGGNLASRLGPPQATVEAALAAFPAGGITVVRRSRLYRSAPVPPSNQPWFINAVAEIETTLDAKSVLQKLEALELSLGRVRLQRNEARIIDLDLLDYRGLIRANPLDPPVLPHPRMTTRAFVLYPLAEIAPNWRHPVSGASIGALIAALDKSQEIAPLDLLA
jgi:2-amino-4-hydroxy-6-hydroxymethyldihydropteridine diphosphokinase